MLLIYNFLWNLGAETTPEFYSCRVLFLAIYLTSSVVTSAFSAALFSLLTIPKSKSQYSILNKVLPNRRYKIALSPNLDFQRALEVSSL